MGNSVGKELALKEAAEIKCLVARKCNSYVTGIENTSVVVNVELTDLKQELAGLILPFQDRPFRSEIGMLEMAALIEDLERHANCHKLAIYVMLQTLNECQGVFEEIVSSRINIIQGSDIISDTAVSNELRLEIEKVVARYVVDLSEAGCTVELTSVRMSELERMLFKLGDSIIIQVKDNVVNEYKNTAYEQIDEILCSEMCDGTFSDPESARSLLQSFVTVYSITKDALDALPFLQRSQIECAQDKLSEYIEDLIRRIQMVYAYNFDESSMRRIMDLESDSDSSMDSDDSDSASEEEGEEGEGDSDSDEEVVAEPNPKKTPAASATKAKKSATPVKPKAETPAAKSAKKDTKKKPEKTPKAGRTSNESSASPAPEVSTGKRKRKPSAKVADGVETPAKRRVTKKDVDTPAIVKRSSGTK